VTLSLRRRSAVSVWTTIAVCALSLSSLLVGGVTGRPTDTQALPTGLAVLPPTVGPGPFTPHGDVRRASVTSAPAAEEGSGQTPRGWSDPIERAGDSRGASRLNPLPGPEGKSGSSTSLRERTPVDRPIFTPSSGVGLSGWPGLNESSCACATPDPAIAIGAGDVVEMANSGVEMWSVNGSQLTTESLDQFFAVSDSSSISQPSVVFDSTSDAWYACAVDGSNGTIPVASSAGAEPTGAWSVDFVPAYPNERPALPSIGTSEWMVGVASNDYNETTGNLDGTGYLLLNRSELGSPSVSYYEANPEYWYPNGRAVGTPISTPGLWFGGLAPTPPHGVAFWLDWSNAPPALPSFRTGGPQVAPFAPPPPASEPGTPDLLNTSDGLDGAVGSVQYSGGLETLVASTGDGCPSLASCLALLQVETASNVLREDYTIGNDSAALFDPSVAADAQGDLTITAVRSSAAAFPDVVQFGQAWNEPNSTTGGASVAWNGSGPETVGCNSSSVCPFGPTSSSAGEPGSPRIWSVAEYLTDTGAWGTWVQASETRNLSLSATAAPGAFDVGGGTYLNASAVGGTGTVGNFTWTDLPAGCAARNSPALFRRPDRAGTFVVHVVANDSYPVAAGAAVSIQVASLPELLPPVANRTGADVGAERSFTVAESFGTPPFVYEWSGLPTGECANVTSSVVICVLPTAGEMTVRASVTDGSGSTATSDPLSYLVAPALSIAAVHALVTNTSTAWPTVSFSVVAAGGSGVYNYTWYGLPGACAPTDGNPVSCVPDAPGVFSVTVRVSDSNGAAETSSPLEWTVSRPAGAGNPTGLLGLPGVDAELVLAALGGAALLAVVAIWPRFRRSGGATRTKDGPDVEPRDDESS